MEIYLLKSTACMGIFLVFYKLLLEKESMHHFKRFFLLTALIFSLIIPQIVFTEYIEAEPTPAVTQVLTINEQPEITPIVHEMEESPMNWTLILYTLYGLGVVIFGFHFLYNIAKLWIRVRRNTQIKFNFLVKVLLKEQLPPHTFLRYIFLNKQKFESKSIPAAVLLHEETHAKEWHSLDVLFIELLQVLFWFNPLIYVFKRSIKLNHEFLADSAVIKGQENKLHYQNTLLSYLSNDKFHTHQSVGIANAINYSSIKKRFIIMKKQTSKRGILIRSVLVFPLMVLLLVSFSSRSTEYINGNSTTNFSIDKTEKKIQKRTVKLAGLVIDSETLEPIINAEIKNYNGTVLTTTDNKGYYSLEFVNAQQGEIDFNLIVKKEGYKPLVQKEHWGNLSGEIKTSMYFGLQKNNGPTPEFSKLFTKNINLDYASIAQNISVIENEKFFTSKLEDVKKGNTNCIVEVNKTPYLVSATSWIKLNSFNDVIAINDETNLPASKLNTYINRNNIKAMSPLESYDTAQYAIYTISGDINANLDKRAFGLYNRLAKKYNAIPITKRTIPLNDLKVLESIYRNMSDAEKKLADPFPECLPKQNQDGASKEQLVYYNELAKKYNSMIADGGNIRILKSDIDQLKHIYRLMSKEQKEHAEPFPDFPEPPPAPKAPKAPNSSDYADNQIKEIIENQDPYDHLNLDINGIKGTSSKTTMELTSTTAPTPPTPPSPLDYAIDMAKKGAIFYFEGEKITSDKAIDLLKKNKELNMESRKKLGKTEVRITTAPVTIR
ncbi:BlaR1 peptidase M56 [Maribacter dokdonensis]|uniref:BlaR1 peptidase M56 n=1 Tax=Maribacter dokdonensis TaxID=320912 RepID=A0ABY0UTS3_9FLAO|nr:M56 family metallopeptidase [Maribacter dokdonensis]SDT16646.1 BlaR1 peptidase M56 [Maribacter dokdonensis]